MHQKPSTIIAFVGFWWLQIACLNVFYPNTTGKYVNIMEKKRSYTVMSPDFDRNQLATDSVAQVKKLLKFKTKTAEYYKYYNDFGVTLVEMGHFSQAEKLFLEIEKQQTNLYSTASNLGTTYELLGENEKALQWIAEGIKRNPDAHERSEWIHLKILETKIILKRDPNYLQTHSVLGTDFGNEILPKYIDAPSTQNIRSYLRLPKNAPIDSILQYLSSQIGYQLQERTHFIKNNDPIMGQLFFDLGNIEAILYSFNAADDIYKYVNQYGYHTVIAEKRMQYIRNFPAAESIGDNEVYDFKANPPKVEFKAEKPAINLPTLALLGFMIIASGWLAVALFRSY